MAEKFKEFNEAFSPDDIAREVVDEFMEEEKAKKIDLGSIGTWGHDLDAKIMTRLKSLEEEDRGGDAELLARHILFRLNSATFKGENIHGEEITEQGSDAIKKAAIESLEKYLSS